MPLRFPVDNGNAFLRTGLHAATEHCCLDARQAGLAPVAAATLDLPHQPENDMTKQLLTKAPSKLDTLEKLLTRKNGASIAEMTKATGWQQHSVRGAMAGALKKRGHSIISDKTDDLRRYRIETAS